MTGFFRLFQPVYSKLQWLLPQPVTDLLFQGTQRKFLRASLRTDHPRPGVPGEPFFAFVVLQYNHPELTRRCVQSIEALPIPGGKVIVIVDNASTDGAGEAIEGEFKGRKGIHVLRLETNLGFARGNNEGYNLARKIREPDFLCLVNSDIVFPSPDFSEAVTQEYAKSGFSILGPDLRPPGKVRLHQNPMRLRFRTIQESVAIIGRLEKELAELEAGTYVPKTPRRSAPGRPVNSLYRQGAIVLHGAAYILSRVFLEDYPVPFDDRTFMYGEEEILCLCAYARGHRLVYSPRILLIHDGEGSSGGVERRAHQLFRVKNSIHSVRMYIDAATEVLQGRVGNGV